MTAARRGGRRELPAVRGGEVQAVRRGGRVHGVPGRRRVGGRGAELRDVSAGNVPGGQRAAADMRVVVWQQ